MSDKPVMVAFAQMLAATRRDATPGVKRLDPGIAPEADDLYVPMALPLERAVAAGWLRQAQGYAEMFRKPGELLAAYMAGGDDFYSNSAQAIVSELRAMESGAAKADEGGAGGLVRAQCALLLAYTREQALAEVGGLDAGVESAWDAMGAALGLDEDDAAELVTAAEAQFLPDLDNALYAAPDDWLPVLEAFLRLTPPEVGLYVDEADIAGYWSEAGVAFAPADEAFLDAALPDRGEGRWYAARATGYELLGRRDDADEALDARRLVVAPAAALEQEGEE